jgi:hypothetical protein
MHNEKRKQCDDYGVNHDITYTWSQVHTATVLYMQTARHSLFLETRAIQFSSRVYYTAPRMNRN